MPPIAQLEAAGIEAPRISAEVLVFHVLGCDRAYLFAHPERELSSREQSQYEALISRRASANPCSTSPGIRSSGRRISWSLLPC